MLVFPGNEEIFGHAFAVVGGYEVLDDAGQAVLVGYLQPVAHVPDDHLRPLLIGKLGMRIDTALVLSEKDGVAELPDVVIEGPGAHELHVGPDARGRGGGKIADLHGVLERAGGFFRKAPQEFVARVGKLDERHVRGEAKALLHGEKQGVGEEKEDAVDQEAEVEIEIDGGDFVAVHELQADVGEGIGEHHEDGHPVELGALGKLAQAVGRHHAGNELEEDEFVDEMQGNGAEQYGGDVGDKGGTRIEQDMDHDGYHGVGDDVDIHQIEPHQKISGQRVADDEEDHQLCRADAEGLFGYRDYRKAS